MEKDNDPHHLHTMLAENSPAKLIGIFKTQVINRVNIEQSLTGLGCRRDIEYQFECLQPYPALCQLASDLRALSVYDLLSFFCMYDLKEASSHKKWVRNMLSGEPNNAGLLWVLANLEFNTYQFREASLNYEFCWRQIPNHPKVAQILLEVNRYHPLNGYFYYEILQFDIQNIKLPNIRKARYEATSRIEYQRLLRTVVEQDKHNVRGWYTLSRLLDDNPSKRIELLKQGLPYQQFSCCLHYELGITYYQLEQFKQAQSYFQTFLANQSYFQEEKRHFSNHYLSQIAIKHKDEQRKNYFKALSKEIDPLQLYGRGLIQSKLSNYRKAVLIWSHMQNLQYQCTFPEYWHERGVSENKLQNYESASFYFKRSFEQYDNEYSLQQLVQTLFMQGKDEEAQAYMSK